MSEQCQCKNGIEAHECQCENGGCQHKGREILSRSEEIDPSGRFKKVYYVISDEKNRTSILMWAGTIEEEPDDPLAIIADMDEHGAAVRETKGYKQ